MSYKWVDNIFFSDPSITDSQSFITLKRQVNDPPVTPSDPRFLVARNVFLNWSGRNDQAFVQFGEDTQNEPMITDALVENNLIIGNSSATLAAPFQFKGSEGITVRANTVVGDLPSGSYGFRIGTEGDNPAVSGFEVRNNIFSDPAGTMGTRLVNTYGDVDNSSITLDHNLYYNGGEPLPSGGDVTVDSDVGRIEGDPLIETDQSNIVMPRWDESEYRFPSGATTIREEFLRLVSTYGAIGSGSAAVDAADPEHMPEVDIRNLPRDGQPDVGAFELNAGGAAGAGGEGGTGGGSTGGSGGNAAGSGGASGASGSSGGSSAGAAGAAGGAAQPAASDEDDGGGCGCRLALRPGFAGAVWWLVAAFALWRRRIGLLR